MEVGSVQSKGSKPAVPIVQTKYRPIAKPDTPSQIRATSGGNSEIVGPKSSDSGSKGEDSLKDRAILYLFLVLSGLMIFWAMKPSSKV